MLDEMTRAWQTALPRLLGGEAAAVVPVRRRWNRRRGRRILRRSAPMVNLGRRPRVAVVQLPGVNCEDESAPRS